MKIPDKIKIGGHWINIILANENDQGYDKSGSRYGWTNKIIIQENMTPSKQESTLLHEIIHEIDWQMGIALEEKQVETLAESLYQVMVDNDLLK